MRFERHKSKCAQCPLGGSKRIWSKGSTSGGIAFFGEAPGDKEVTQGEPFVGPAGSYFSWALKNTRIERSQNWVGNISPCKYPANDFWSMDAQDSRECCTQGLHEELKWLKAKGVRVIVALGGAVQKIFNIKGRISDTRGSVYEAFGFYVIPTFHPSYFQRMSRKRDDGSIQNLRIAWLYDLVKAKRIASSGWHPPKENFTLFPSTADVESWVDRAIEADDLIAVDIETTGFNRDYSELVVVGLARNSEDALSVPFLSQGGEHYFSNGDKDRVNGALNRLFSSNRLLFQNALFDVPYLQAKGYEVNLRAVAHDTLILHGVIAPELPHKLGFIVSIYGDTPYWKDDLLGRTGSILEMDDRTLRTYNARDCVVLHQVLPPMLGELDELGVRHIYEGESLKLLEPIGEMTSTGMVLDKKRLGELRREYESKREELDGALRSTTLGAIPPAFNFDSPADMAWLLYEKRPPKFNRLEELKEYSPETCTKKAKDGTPRPLKKSTKKYKALLELQEIHDSCPTFLRPKRWKPRKTSRGALSTDAQNCLSLDLALAKRVREIESFKREKAEWKVEKGKLEEERSWLKLYREYCEVGKILSTYLDYTVGLDGKVHGGFLIHGTATGRLSSAGPNLQNLPKRRKELREVFIPEPGHIFVSGDYSNLEVRVLAYITGDEVLIDAFERGENIHDINTKTLFPAVKEGSKQWHLARDAAKVFMFGGISYGGSDNEIYEKVSLKAPDLGLQPAEFKRAKARWMAAHPAYTRWAEEVQRRAERTRFSETFNGRRRELTGSTRDIAKQALNSPIQGGAGAVINDATVRLYAKKPPQWKFVVQVHDQLMMQVPVGEEKDCALLMKREMEAPVEINGVERVFPVDFEAGYSFGTLASLEL